MAIRFNKVEECAAPVAKEPGEYLMKITECDEKTSQAGNEYIRVVFQDNDGMKIYNNFFAYGKAANNLLALLSALGKYDGNGWENLEFECEDLLGEFVYVDCQKDKENKYLEAKFCGYRAYEQEIKTPPKAPKKTQAAPF